VVEIKSLVTLSPPVGLNHIKEQILERVGMAFILGRHRLWLMSPTKFWIYAIVCVFAVCGVHTRDELFPSESWSI